MDDDVAGFIHDKAFSPFHGHCGKLAVEVCRTADILHLLRQQRHNQRAMGAVGHRQGDADDLALEPRRGVCRCFMDDAGNAQQQPVKVGGIVPQALVQCEAGIIPVA